MKSRNTEAIEKLAKEKTKTKQEQVIKEIDRMIKKGKKISIYSVAKNAEVSRSFLYNNEVISKKINEVRNINGTQNIATTKTLLEAQKIKIQKLEKENTELKKANSYNYKEKYENMFKENEELKKQLKMAYNY